MRRRILAATLAVTAAALLIFGVPLGWSVGHVYRSQELTRPRPPRPRPQCLPQACVGRTRSSRRLSPPGCR